MNRSQRALRCPGAFIATVLMAPCTQAQSGSSSGHGAPAFGQVSGSPISITNNFLSSSKQTCPEGQIPLPVDSSEAQPSSEPRNKTRCCPAGQYPSGSTCCPREMMEQRGSCVPMPMEEACIRGDRSLCGNLALSALGSHDRQQAERFGKLTCGESGSGTAVADGCYVLASIDSSNSHAILKLLNRSCRAGSVSGCERLFDKLDIDRQPAEAADALSRACDLGSQKSCHNLGTLRVKQGVHPAEALPLFNRSCANGSGLPESCYSASVITMHSQPTSSLQTAHWACDRGLATGCHWLGLLYAQGIGTKPDMVEASVYFLQACRNDIDAACYHIGNAFAVGWGVARDHERAGELLERACTLGDVRGCAKHAVLTLLNDETPATFERSKAVLGESCAQAGEGCFQFGLMQLMDNDESEGNKNIAKACAKEDSGACDFKNRYAPKRIGNWSRFDFSLGPAFALMFGNPSVREGASGGIDVSAGFSVLEVHSTVLFNPSKKHDQYSTLALGLTPMSWPTLQQSSWAVLRPAIGAGAMLGAIRHRRSVDVSFMGYAANSFVVNCWLFARVEYQHAFSGTLRNTNVLSTSAGVSVPLDAVYHPQKNWDSCGNLRMSY